MHACRRKYTEKKPTSQASVTGSEKPRCTVHIMSSNCTIHTEKNEKRKREKEKLSTDLGVIDIRDISRVWATPFSEPFVFLICTRMHSWTNRKTIVDPSIYASIHPLKHPFSRMWICNANTFAISVCSSGYGTTARGRKKVAKKRKKERKKKRCNNNIRTYTAACHFYLSF